MKVRRKFAFNFAVSALVGVSMMVAARGFAAIDPIPDEKKTALVERLKENREVINESEAEKRRLLGSLYAINQRMKKISRDKGKLTDELIQSQDAVGTVAGAIQLLEAQIEKQRLSLKTRLRALYKISGESYIGAVFSTTNAFEFDSTLRNLKIISDRDFSLIRSYRTNLALLSKQRKKLKTQVEKLLLVEKRIQRQENLLAQEHGAKSALAHRIDSETRKRISEIRRLRQKTDVADSEIESLLKPSIYEKRGSLQAPVAAGTIVRDFGLYIDEKYRFKISHKGWSIAVTASTPVVAADDGRIVFSGELEGYGRTIIVDHNDHYYTVYAGISTSVAVGDSVAKGAKIAIATPSDRLYFEIRHFSEPENPSQWISPKSSILTAQVSMQQGVSTW